MPGHEKILTTCGVFGKVQDDTNASVWTADLQQQQQQQQNNTQLCDIHV
jgi:hypothetical protein